MKKSEISSDYAIYVNKYETYITYIKTAVINKEYFDNIDLIDISLNLNNANNGLRYVTQVEDFYQSYDLYPFCGSSNDCELEEKQILYVYDDLQKNIIIYEKFDDGESRYISSSIRFAKFKDFVEYTFYVIGISYQWKNNNLLYIDKYQHCVTLNLYNYKSLKNVILDNSFIYLISYVLSGYTKKYSGSDNIIVNYSDVNYKYEVNNNYEHYYYDIDYEARGIQMISKFKDINIYTHQ